MATRRQFMTATAALAAFACLPRSLPAQTGTMREEYLLIGDGHSGGETLFGANPYAPRPGTIKIWQPGKKRVDQIDLPFFPHSFAAHPKNPQRLLTFEKWGRHLAEVDIVELSVLRVTEAAAGRRFFGHGAHSGSHIYVSQMNDAGHRGQVAVYDPESFKLTDEIETGGAFPHECLWLPETEQLLVLNSRSSGLAVAQGDNPSSLAWLDGRTGKRAELQVLKGVPSGFAHFARAQDGNVILAGSHDYKDGSHPLLAVMQENGVVQLLDDAAGDKNMRGEALSLYLDERNHTVTATFPLASRIQTWDYQTRKLLGQLQMDEPRGLAYSSTLGSLLASGAHSKELSVLEKGLAQAHGVRGSMGSGSHLFHHVI